MKEEKASRCERHPSVSVFQEERFGITSRVDRLKSDLDGNLFWVVKKNRCWWTALLCLQTLDLTAKMIQCYVFDYFEVNNRQHPFTCNLAGEKWFRLFLKRHPQLRHRKAQAMNPARAQKLNRFIVNDHFTKLEHILTDHDLFNKPDRIFNLNEKGCRLSLHHQQ